MLCSWSLHWFRRHWGWWLRWHLWFVGRCTPGRCTSCRWSFRNCPRFWSLRRRVIVGCRCGDVCWGVWRVPWSWLSLFWRCLRVGWWQTGWPAAYFHWRWFWSSWRPDLREFLSFLYLPLIKVNYLMEYFILKNKTINLFWELNSSIFSLYQLCTPKITNSPPSKYYSSAPPVPHFSPLGVGKSSLLLKYISNKFSYDYQVTTGV